LNFKKNKNKLEAAGNKHDDIIMSVSFALSCAMIEKPSMFKIL
jgi:hypothetical protein